MRPEWPEGINREKGTPFQAVQGGVKAFIVEPFSPMGKRLRLHQFDKSLQVNFRCGDVLRCDAALGTHPLNPIGNPGLEKQLT